MNSINILIKLLQEMHTSQQNSGSIMNKFSSNSLCCKDHYNYLLINVKPKIDLMIVSLVGIPG